MWRTTVHYLWAIKVFILVRIQLFGLGRKILMWGIIECVIFWMLSCWSWIKFILMTMVLIWSLTYYQGGILKVVVRLSNWRSPQHVKGDVLCLTPNYVSKKFKLVKLILCHLTQVERGYSRSRESVRFCNLLKREKLIRIHRATSVKLWFSLRTPVGSDW